jgi:hypothetical protein
MKEEPGAQPGSSHVVWLLENLSVTVRAGDVLADHSPHRGPEAVACRDAEALISHSGIDNHLGLLLGQKS